MALKQEGVPEGFEEPLLVVEQEQPLVLEVLAAELQELSQTLLVLKHREQMVCVQPEVSQVVPEVSTWQQVLPQMPRGTQATPALAGGGFHG